MPPEWIPPNERARQPAEPEWNVAQAWGAVEVFGGLCVLAIVVTVCLLVLAAAGVV